VESADSRRELSWILEDGNRKREIEANCETREGSIYGGLDFLEDSSQLRGSR